jgi:hypothetical protein
LIETGRTAEGGWTESLWDKAAGEIKSETRCDVRGERYMIGQGVEEVVVVVEVVAASVMPAYTLVRDGLGHLDSLLGAFRFAFCWTAVTVQLPFNKLVQMNRGIRRNGSHLEEVKRWKPQTWRPPYHSRSPHLLAPECKWVGLGACTVRNDGNVDMEF